MYRVYYPGWTTKSITFTIDDGNLTLDRKFMNYVKPAGLRGTFNLTTPLHGTREEYSSLYAGYEIANHCHYHAYPFTTDRDVVIKDELFDPATADKAYGYKTAEEGIYRIYTYAWTYLADDERYMQCVDRCQKELEEIFGAGSVHDYIWPCGGQKNEQVFKALQEYGFRSIRTVGCVEDKTGFALPADRMTWSYNADYTCLTRAAAAYEAYPDDGELKFFCFGVHSHDFERNNAWDVLIDFCRLYGNRPETYWYASVGAIFEYEDAVRALQSDGKTLYNPSAVDLYCTVNGRRVTLCAGERISLSE